MHRAVLEIKRVREQAQQPLLLLSEIIPKLQQRYLFVRSKVSNQSLFVVAQDALRLPESLRMHSESL